MPNLPLKLQGIAPDLPVWEQGESWSTCQNMRFPRGQVSERVSGNDDTGVSTGIFPGYLQNYYDISSNYWLISSTDGVQSWDGASPPDTVTPPTWGTLSDPGQWTGTRGPFLQWLIVNTVERAEPYVFDSATQGLSPMESYLVASTHAAPNCTCLRSLFNSFLFCLDTADDVSGNWDSTPQTVVWSDSSTGSLPTFIPAGGNRAGSTTLATSTPLIECIGLRESAILFSSTDIFRVDFIGSQEIFDFTRIFSGDGILARNCCTEYEGTVYFLSTSGALMATDGTNVTTIADDKVNRTILASLADDARGSWCTANPLSREIVFAPLSINETAPTTGYLLDVDSGRIGQRTFPDQGAPFGLAGVNSATADDSWDGGEATSWNAGRDVAWNYRDSTPGSAILFFTTLAEKLYRADVNETTTAGQLIRSGIVPDPQSDRVFLCRRVWVDANIPTDGLTVSVGGRFDDSSSYQGQTEALTPGTRSVPVSVKGRQFRLEVNGSGVSGWDISRISLELAESHGRF